MKSTKTPRLGIIGSVGVPAKYGGFETLAHFLVKNLNKRFHITVYCSAKSYEEHERRLTWNGAKLEYIPLHANGLQSILYDLWSMVHAIRNCDQLLILGVSGCMFLPLIRLFSKKKIIVNIDGLEWRRPKWNKYAKKFLLISEKIACHFADEIITDNRILKEYVQIRYGRKGNLVEYGADHVKKVRVGEKDIEEYPFLNRNYAFKVARIEPENHLHTILEAFSKLPNQEIVIVGNWDNSGYGRNLKTKYGTFQHIHLLDPIYQPNRLNLLRSNAKYYVHGHSAGGTNPSLVEAMSLKLPIVALDVIYNRVTTNNQAIYFEDVKDLTSKIANIDKHPLFSIAKTMKDYADKRYTWKNIAWRYGNIIEGFERVDAPIIQLQPTSKLAAQALESITKLKPRVKTKTASGKVKSLVKKDGGPLVRA